MRNYFKIVIYHFFLFLMLCALLGACGAPQPPVTAYPENFDSSATSPVATASDDQQVTLHLIIIADTDDISIGESTKIDLRNMKTLMRKIAVQSYGKIALKSLTRNKRITRQELLNILKRLQVQPQDIIVFHWAGHGHGSSGAKWPYLDTAVETTDFTQVIKMLNSKNTRQVIALADCCNAPLIDTQDMYMPARLRQQYFYPENIKKMFIQPEIKIFASGSQAGQYASGTNSLGGYFTYNFIITLEEALLNENNPDSAWEKVMRTTRQRVLFDTKNKQAPQYEIIPVHDRESDNINKNDIDELEGKQGQIGATDVMNKEAGGTLSFDQLLDKILKQIP